MTLLRAAFLLAAALIGCGGGVAPAQVPVDTVVRMDFIARPAADGTWYVQGGNGHPDPDHAPTGGNPSVRVVGNDLELAFGRAFTHAGVIQVTSDDDFGKAGISAHCNLGLAGSRCVLMHRWDVIAPAQVIDLVPPGSGNFWVSVTMVDRR